MSQVSLTKRVVLLSSLWTVLSLVILGWLLFSQFRAGAIRNFHDLQKAQLFSLIGAVTINDNGKISGEPNLGNASFLRPGSGWFWRIELVDSVEKNAIESPSISGVDFARPTLEELPFDTNFERTYISENDERDNIRVLETEIDLGESTIALFQIGGNHAEFQDEIQRFAFRTISLLSVFGLGAVLINMLIILFGLRPLDRIRRALSDIRAGRSEALDGDFPIEIAPMVHEMNTLVDNNRRVVERARTQVGNLAHSLKTPIAVLLNEGNTNKTISHEIVKTQANNMQTQVQHYLSRARIAAQLGSVTYQTDAIATLRRLISVMQKLNPDKKISFDSDLEKLTFSGEREDFEEIVGNLLENACKWGNAYIRIMGRKTNTNQIEISIEDDGLGVPEGSFEKVLKRGHRLDETMPGTGLGLSIVADTVEAYGGETILGKSNLGGLKVTIILPSTTDLDQ